MPTPRDDHALLRAYVERRDDDAFAELVARHADMVYAAASRQVGRGGLAEDVTQATFILLARKASNISERVVVAAWLHKATRYTALNAMKIEQRRRIHERRAGEFAVAARPPVAARTTNAEVNWDQGAAILDEGIARLAGRDREAVVLRFLERRSYSDVGEALGVSEEAAQMRVGRAVEKLRGFFRRRGLVVSAAALRAVVNANVIAPAPLTLKSSLASTAIYVVRASSTASTTVTSNAASIADGASEAMEQAATRMTTAFVGSGIAAAAAVAMLLTFWLVQHQLDRPVSKPELPESRAAIHEEGRPSARAKDDKHIITTWAATPVLAAAQQINSEVYAQQR